MNKESFKEFVLDQLEGLDFVKCRAMFGGHGLYRGEIFFGIISKGRVYFKTDEGSKKLYTDKGMKPFRPNPRQTLKNYYEVPPDVLEDAEAFVQWARRATGETLDASIGAV